MPNKILCSTGTFVGRANGFDYRQILLHKNDFHADGFELMMLKAWYDDLPGIAAALLHAGVNTPVLHFEKDTGALLAAESEEDRREGMRLFIKNADMAQAIGAEKAVFHLWDGRFSENSVKQAVDGLNTLYEICEKRGFLLAVENVPCHAPRPYSIIREISTRYSSAMFTFDTRHASFMGECELFFGSELWSKRICHFHVSDYTGETVPNMWGVTRPILQPGDGIIDFDALFGKMPPYNGGTVTLESPSLSTDGFISIEPLNRSLDFLKKVMGNR